MSRKVDETQSRLQTLRRPLEAALADQLLQLDRHAMRAWQILGLFGTVLGLVVAATVSASMGLLTSLASAIFLAFFTWVERQLRKGPLSRGQRYAVTTVETLMPWLYALVVIFTEGPRYALASWLPPGLFAAILILGIARLLPEFLLLNGAIGAVCWLAIYLLVRPRLGDVSHELVYSATMQVTRMGTLLVSGTIGFLVARELRRAIGRADQHVRETELFGKYRLGKLVAAGGMGSVHEATYCPEGGFERRVAVKLLHPHLALDPTFVRGFRAEAELGARLAHPNVVTILDFGRQRGAYFLAMEFVEGKTLARVLGGARERAIPIPMSVVAHVGSAILAGLDHAHRGAFGADGEPLRIVHRDMCPQNVLVSRGGDVKISDFGLARALREANAAHTRTIAGHDAYMAPEQIRGEPLDPRADLFATGVILWEMLAGRRLFACANEAATIAAVLSDPVMPPSVLRPELGPEWDEFFGKAIARDPAERFQTAAEMRRQLFEIAGGGDSLGRESLVALLAATDAQAGDHEHTDPDVGPDHDDAPTRQSSSKDFGYQADVDAPTRTPSRLP